MDAERRQAAVRRELVAVRQRGVARLDHPALKKLETSTLEVAARKVPGYHDRLTRIGAIYLLLEHEIPLISQPHQGWLETMFALPEKLRSIDPGELRDRVAKSIGESPSNFRRKGGKADQAITSLAAQIVADFFQESSDEAQEMPATQKHRLKYWLVAVVVIVILAVGGVLVFSSFDEHPPSPDALSLEARYDGKLANGQSGEAESHCADGNKPPSQEVASSHPPVFGPDGRIVGSIQLRTSYICPVIWARVLWSDGNYQIPDGWTLHVVAHRPDTNTSIDAMEPMPGYSQSSTPIPYALSYMLTTIRGCVYVEAFFTSGEQRTTSVPTTCVNGK
jgi:hypothetical protein